MDFKQELSDCEYEYEQPAAGAAPRANTGAHHSVLVLSEMEADERLGRTCRALKYRVEYRGADSNDEKKAFAITDGREDSAKPTARADLKSHVEGRTICRRDSESRSLSAEGEREARTSSPQTDSDPKSSKRASRKAPSPQVTKSACNLCGAEYVSRAKLKAHMMLHTGETPYTCKVCAKGFRRSDWLAKHMNTHLDKTQAPPKKEYPCDRCEKKYKSIDGLQGHLRKHKGERPYQCPICEKRFYDHRDLKMHMMCHYDYRPFTCSECGHSFKRGGTLRKHMRIHTGEKPYSCSGCKKRFPYKYSVTMHQKICSKFIRFKASA